MNNTVRVLRDRPLRWSEGLQENSKSLPTRVNLEWSLSFLSLGETAKGYPDTGESGDAYDAEVTTKS